MTVPGSACGVELLGRTAHIAGMMAPSTLSIPFDNSYARLPERFHRQVAPTQVRAPQLIRLNESLAVQLGLDPAALSSPDGIAMLAGNQIASGSEPIAMAYAGHQFGNFVPQLGDGRAILLGELIDAAGRRRDIQLKGSGRTPFSRMGDGRAALGPVLREYLVSEAFAALGIPTTRALAALTTGEWVYREEPLPGAILVRVAASHIRVGTFQYFAVRQDGDAVRLLADHVIDRHYPQIGEGAGRYRKLLDAVIAAQASLIARWMSIGFIHGVMNTDNASIAGETIDFGPCAFMDVYHPATVFSSIDSGGRYAFSNQPAIARWNLTRFAETLLPMLAATEPEAIAAAEEALGAYASQFQDAVVRNFAIKIGVEAPLEDGDTDLVQDLLTVMANGEADFTNAFRTLARLCDPADAEAAPAFLALFKEAPPVEAWLARWRARLSRGKRSWSDTARAMNAANPAIIPRNHLVEAAIRAAVDRDDFKPFRRLADAVADPFNLKPGDEDLTWPPRPEDVVHQTFCGT